MATLGDAPTATAHPGGLGSRIISRRAALGLLGAAALSPAIQPARAAAPATIRAGVLKFGTVNWELDTIRRLDLDSANGIRIESVQVASNDATRIAFMAGDVDVIATDLLLAARLTAEGTPVVYIPFSASEGGVMVAKDAPYRTLADLKGKKLAVAGGPLDKSWLLLRAYAESRDHFDLATAVEPAFGAPPLLADMLADGQFDAALLFWNFCARLEAKGFRTLISTEEAARAFGATGAVALIGYVFKAEFAARHPEAVDGFAAASKAAKQVLATSASAWDALRPLMQAEDPAVFDALKRRFIDGIPNRPIAEEEADAARLYAVIAEIGGPKLVGPAKTLPKGLYWTGHAASP